MNKEEIIVRVQKDIKKTNIANRLLKNEIIRHYFFVEKAPVYRKKALRDFYINHILQFAILFSASMYLYHIDYSFFSFLTAAVSFYKIYTITKNKDKVKLSKPYKLEHKDFIFISQHFDEKFVNDFMFAFDKDEQTLESIISSSDYKTAENVYKDLYVKNLFNK